MCDPLLCVCALTSQNMADNDLGLEGARIISDFLQENNSSLCKLQLSGEPIAGMERPLATEGETNREDLGSSVLVPEHQAASSPCWTRQPCPSRATPTSCFPEQALFAAPFPYFGHLHLLGSTWLICLRLSCHARLHVHVVFSRDFSDACHHSNALLPLLCPVSPVVLMLINCLIIAGPL